jgi:hypothetical protein
MAKLYSEILLHLATISLDACSEENFAKNLVEMMK